MKLSTYTLAMAAAMTLCGAAGAATITYTFNANSLTTTVANGSNGAVAPNIASIGAGYRYDNGTSTGLVMGGSIGYWGSNGFGVMSPHNNCGTLPANTSSISYSCVNGSTDAHYFDNNGNGAQVRGTKSGPDTYSPVRIDDFARIRFDADVTVTSLTLGLWDWDSEKSGTEDYCTRYYSNGSCRSWGKRDVYEYFIDLVFNTGDSESSAWTPLRVSLGANAPDTGDTLVVNTLGAYAPNDWFGIGAGFGLSGTGFKLMAMTVTRTEEGGGGGATGQSVPEPGTLASLGLGAFAMALAGARRRRVRG